MIKLVLEIFFRPKGDAFRFGRISVGSVVIVNGGALPPFGRPILESAGLGGPDLSKIRILPRLDTPWPRMVRGWSALLDKCQNESRRIGDGLNVVAGSESASVRGWPDAGQPQGV